MSKLVKHYRNSPTDERTACGNRRSVACGGSVSTGVIQDVTCQKCLDAWENAKPIQPKGKKPMKTVKAVKPAKQRPIFEYHVEEGGHEYGPDIGMGEQEYWADVGEQTMNDLGAEGWELVCQTTDRKGYVFKRVFDYQLSIDEIRRLDEARLRPSEVK